MILNNGKDWEPSRVDVMSWELAFSHVDIGQELLKMDCWLQANPGRRKTARGMNRFIVSWLGRITVKAESTSTRDRSIEDDLNDRSWAL